MGTEQRRLVGDDASVYRGDFQTGAISTALAADTLVKIAAKSTAIQGVLSADLVTSNVITTTITLNGVALTAAESTFATDHATTMTAHIAAIEALTGVSCVAVGARGFRVLADVATQTLSMTSVVTLGASQATVAITSSSVFGELAVGDLYIHRSTSDITMITGDTYYPLVVSGYNQMMDLSSVTIEVTANKIDTTVLADAFMTARNGKKDLTGTVEFIYIKGITDDPDTGVMNSFFRIARIDNTGVATVEPVRTTPYLLVIWLDGTDTTAGYDKIFIVLPVEFESFTVGGALGSAQTTSCPFHIVGGVNPTIYRVQNAAA